MKPIQLSFKVQDCCGTDNQTLQSNIDMQGLKQLPVAIIGGGSCRFSCSCTFSKTW